MKNKLTNHIKNKLGKYSVIYCPSKNFIWYKVPKTAGTSMFRGVMLKELDDVISYKAHPKEFDLWWDNLTDEKIQSYYTFTFIRNPFDRLVSAFSHLVIENVFEEFKKVEPILNGKESNILGYDFNTTYSLWILFVMRCMGNSDMEDQSMYSGSAHWMPQYNFCVMDGLQHVDFIGSYENLKNDWKTIAKKIGVTETLPYVGASTNSKTTLTTREKHMSIPWDWYYVNSDLINKVYNYYEQEIKLLGYDEQAKTLLSENRLKNLKQ